MSYDIRERGPIKITFEMENEEGDFVEVHLPTRKEVCDTCQGEGRHVNPSIDSDGLSAEDFDEDPDFREAYFSGAYDQTCNTCDGLRVMDVVDESRADPKMLEAYFEQMEQRARWDAEAAAERRMGA